MPAHREPLIVAGHEVQPGKSKRFEIPVAVLSTGTPVSIPVTVIHGAHPGPKLLISAAIHGDEINGVEIVRQILADSGPKTLRGSIVAVPVLNVFGYLMGSRYLPDRRDLNRSFPGSAKGSLASQMAHLFLSKLVSHADFAIDLHTGSGGRTNLPQIRANLGHEPTRQAAMAFGAPIVIQARLRANSYRAVAASRGLPILLYEGGEAHRFDRESIRVGVEGIWRVMAHLGMRLSHQEPYVPLPFVASETTWIRTSRGGVLHCAAHPGDMVQAGELLGRTTDIYGKTRSRIVAPWSGMIIGMACNPLVTRGDGVLHVARRASDGVEPRT
ncbi:MAG: succinylglutamate desuccinylase/aspartoacylase family protein [Fimbriimonadaceae bacterium]|nr:succinylglutamate desuccinylase/aspartoacylase family protein [Fimbriimonadaceae bacterium]QYK58694.1 MAG: succinylglutamate desuccinylase/aspartoacylase family protein [Fimbriimonadaceae bacterium]